MDLLGFYDKLSRTMHRILTIKGKLMISLVVYTLAPVMIIGYAGYVRYTGNLRDRAQVQAVQTADATAAMLERRLSNLQVFAIQILYDSRVYLESSRISNPQPDDLLTSVMEFQKYLQTILAARTDISEMYLEVGSLPTVYQESKDRRAETLCAQYAREVKTVAMTSGGKPVVCSFRRGDQAPCMFVGKMVYDVNDFGRVAGYMMFRVDIPQLFDGLSTLNGTDTEIRILNDSELQIFPEIVQSPGAIHPVFSFSRGLGEVSLHMTLQMSQAGMLQDIRQVALMTLLLCLLLLPAFFVIANFLYFDLVRPLKVLINHMKQMEDGRFGELIHSRRQDEYGYVFRAYNNLSSTMERLINTVYKREIAVRDAQIQALQSQINPHFLYNTLDSINWKARIAGVNEISEMVGAFSRIIEAGLNREGEVFVSLEKEMSFVEAYVLLISKRFGKKIVFESQISQAILQAKVPKLIIQPLVENAVYHGLEPKVDQGHVLVLAEVRDGNLSIRVEDDGVGVPGEKLEILHQRMEDQENTESPTQKAGRIGILNVHRRLRLLYGAPFGMNLESVPGSGTQVTLILPVELPAGDTDEESDI